RSTLPEKRQVIGECAQPNSALRVCRNGLGLRNLRRRERLADLEITDADEPSLNACAFRPNIAFDILGDTEYQTHRMMSRFGDTPEAAIFVDEEPIVNPNPNVALTVFEQ